MPTQPRFRADGLVRPAMRGWLHLGAVPVVAVLGLLLVVIADTTRTGLTIYAVAATALFGISAAYHRGNWAARGHAIVSRLDHAMIFVIIAATYTPVALTLMPTEQARLLLIVVWTGALAGVAFRVLWFSAPRWLYTPLYLLLGWIALPFLDQLSGAGPVFLGLLVAGGICYTAGAVIYALKRPDPAPTIFGFHEIFHGCTLGGWALHFSAIALIVA